MTLYILLLIVIGICLAIVILLICIVDLSRCGNTKYSILGAFY